MKWDIMDWIAFLAMFIAFMVLIADHDWLGACGWVIAFLWRLRSRRQEGWM